MAKCPVCIIELGAKIPMFCSQCRWETGRDLTLNKFLDINPSEVTDYTERLQNHKVIWGMMLESKKQTLDREAQIQTEQQKAKELQEKLKKIEQEQKEDEIKAKSSNMIYVEGGTFNMGSNYFDDEMPIHKVTVSSFKMSKYQLTVKEYRAYCNATGTKMPETPDWGWNDADPVVNVSWNDAQGYCKWAGVRLPTEAEWEYAARGGNKSKGYKYSGSDNIDNVAWFGTNSNGKVHQVGTKQPNELGLYDMSGNVWEWCSDLYDENYYKNGPENNPKGPSSGSSRVLRGGSWSSYDYHCRVAYRIRNNPDYRYNYLGFRVVQD